MARSRLTRIIAALAVALCFVIQPAHASRQPGVKAAPQPESAYLDASGSPVAPAATVIPPFFDNVESGTGSWNATGFWHRVVNPQAIRVSEPIRANLVRLPDSGYLPQAYSGSAAWWYGEDVTGTFIGHDYNTSQESLSGGTSTGSNTGVLVSPAFNLAGMQSAGLSFSTWWEIEGVDVDRYDMMYVDVSTNGGTTYTQLHSLNPLNDVDAEHYICYSTGGVNAAGQWGQVFVDLSAYVGQTVVLRFRFDTNDHLYNGYRGWLIDDIRVSAQAAPTLSLSAVQPGTARPGDIVTLYGSGFMAGASVVMGGMAAEETTIFDTRILAYVPGLSPGTYDVTVTNPNQAQATLTNGLTVSSGTPPTITAVGPASGDNTAPVSLSVNGTGFANGATVLLGSTPLTSVVVASATRITAVVPAGLPVGHYNITVKNPDNLQATLYAAYEVTGPNTGSLTGTVVDSQNAQPLSGAVITYSGAGSGQVATNAQGQYALNNLPVGPYNVAVAKAGYVSESTPVLVQPGATTVQNFALSALAPTGTYRVVLSWGASPDDLDSHMWVPQSSGCYHVYFSDEGFEASPPYTFLDVDDTSSYGPETITLVQRQPGTYQYWVHNYSGEPDITTSQAVVKLYSGDALVRTYTIPTSPTGFLWWHVFDLNPNSGLLTDVNTLHADASTAGCDYQECNYLVTPARLRFGKAGGDAEISVTCQSGCPWGVLSNASWLTPMTGTSYTGSGTVTVRASTMNGSIPRSTGINVAGQTITVQQGAPSLNSPLVLLLLD